MRAEPGAEGDEPEVTGAVGRFFVEGAVEGEENGRAAHVAEVAEHFAAGVERMRSDDGLDGVEDIAAAGMRDNAGDGARAAAGPQFANGSGGEFRDGAVEEVAEFAVALLEPKLVAVGGEMKRIEIEGAERNGMGGRFGAPDRSGGTVGEEAGADENAGIVVEVKRGGADFDGDAGDGRVGVGGENVAGAAQHGNGGAAAEADEILKKGVGAKAELFGDVAGQAGAEIARAGADEERVEIGRTKMKLVESGREGAACERGCFVTKAGVELVGREVEDVGELGGREVAFGDAVIAVKDGAKDELRFPAEAVAHGRELGHRPAIGGREGRGRDGGGKRVEKHLVQCGVKRAEREQARAVEELETALVRGTEKKRVECASGCETEAEATLQGEVNFATSVRPGRRAPRICEERIEGKFRALKGHGHAVARERCDHGAGVAEADVGGARNGAVEIDGGDGAEGIRLKLGVGDTFGERGEPSGVEVSEEECGAGGAEGATEEEAADVDAIVFDARESDVGVIAEMHFEIARERKIAGVDFKADPLSRGATAAGGENAAWGVGERGETCASAKLAAGGDKRVGESVIEGVAAQPEGGRREFLDTRKRGASEPGDIVVERGIGEKRIELEAVARLRRETGDEFAADAVARVVAGFENGDVDSGATEREAEAETREPAADDFDGTEGSHERRMATRW